MPTFACPVRTPRPWLRLICLCLLPAAALAQPVCNSDGQSVPSAVLERFISADCATCWQGPSAPTAAPGELVLDWIVPGRLGDEAPLSAAASRDALERLQDLGLSLTDTATHQRTKVRALDGTTLRLTHGPAVGNYVGVTMTLRLPAAAPLRWPVQMWLVLTEVLPAGTEHAAVPRNLARNTFQPIWNKGEMLLQSKYLETRDLRAMAMPEGTQPARVRLAGWVQDASGQVLVATQTVCTESPDQ